MQLYILCFCFLIHSLYRSNIPIQFWGKKTTPKLKIPPPLVKCSSFHLSPWCHTFLLLAKTYSKYFNIQYSKYSGYYSYPTDNSHKRTEHTAILAFLFIWGWMINSFKHVLEPQRSRSCTVRTHHSRMWNTKPYASFWSKWKKMNTKAKTKVTQVQHVRTLEQNLIP